MTACLLDEALALAQRGWPIFPVQPPLRGDKTTGKKPLTPRGCHEATTDQRTIHRWWGDRWPEASIGLATGKGLRAWVLDVDGELGEASLAALEAEFGEPLPKTLTAKTGGGGRHLFFSYPEDREIRNKQSVRPGLDVRGCGGYVVCAPSPSYTGRAYAWLTSPNDPPAAAPRVLLDFLFPLAKVVPPWERVSPAQPLARAPVAGSAARASVIERARKYLAEVDPAVQGSGGHNQLLCAARALVVGFDLDDATAISLLWSEFNPKCQPPWNPDDERDRRDFERKVAEVRRTPAGKPVGWLLDEFNLRTGTEAMAQIARGAEIASALLASAAKRGAEPEAASACAEDPEEEGPEVREPFPTDALPAPIAEWCRQIAEAHGVDESVVALAMITVAGAALGNAWRLELKRGFVVPPLVWAAILAGSGSNKTAPLKLVVGPLQRPVPLEHVESLERNPQAQALVGNATVEAVVARLKENPRGLLCFNDELAGWVKSFGAYKKGGGGDEQAWLEFWNGNYYTVDRKTDNEHVSIPAASVAVLGGIQPLVFVKAFSTDSFASGLVQRLLVTMPPRRLRRWTEAEVSDATRAAWSDAVTWLRTRPFAGQNTDRCEFEPCVLTLTPEAKAAFVHFVNSGGAQDDERAESFAAKAEVAAARIALILHGMGLAVGARELELRVGVEAMNGAIRVARWCLAEQLRVFGFAARESAERRLEAVVAWIRSRIGKGKGTTAREYHQSHRNRYADADEARADLQRVVSAGLARWDGKSCVLNEGTRRGDSSAAPTSAGGVGPSKEDGLAGPALGKPEEE